MVNGYYFPLLMKKLHLIIIALTVTFSVKAQWVDNPASNTFLANCSSDASEIRVAASSDGGVFVQWASMSSNGWSPKLQYVDVSGVPQWGDEGIAVTTPNLATWSPGYAMAVTSDNAVISMFRTADAHHWVVKICEDGSTPWGTDGIMLFNGAGGGRSELLAGDDGGFWALGTDMDDSFLQYVNADGSLRTMATINDPEKKCSNGKLITADNGVFVVYSKHTLQGYSYYNKEIYVAGYNKDGEQIYPETLLLGLQTIGVSYIHHAISDGIGGGYVFQWHNAIGGVYNTYITHFDNNGTPTISEPNGITVHSTDYESFYINAYPSIDPVTHDLLLVYRQTDAASQSQYKIFINRITSSGEKPWGDGILVLDNGTNQCLGMRIDAFNYLDGFSVIYHKAVPGVYGQTIEAHGFDSDGNMQWNTTLCDNTYPKNIGENTSGFNNAQNVVVWVNAEDGGLYGQNLGEYGDMGDITIPVPCCHEPEDFEGAYIYNYETSSYGVMLTWTSPAYSILNYNLYRQNLDDATTEIIEVNATATSYFEELPAGTYKYRLTAQYPDFESDFALTPDGTDYLIIEVPDSSSVPEIEFNEIIEIINIYNINGQVLNTNDLNELSQGVYIIKGVTKSGRTNIVKISK